MKENRNPSVAPSPEEIRRLVAFLPLLYAEGFEPVEQWEVGTTDEDTLTFPWPRYNPPVDQFYALASAPAWSDHEYSPSEAYRMLTADGFVENASLGEVKTMLTYCVRGERFCDGHWAAMIEEGHIRRLLERLAALLAEDGAG